MSGPASVYKAYSKATYTAPKLQQVVMLYDGTIRFVQQVREAIEKNDIETRFNKLVKAGDVIMALQASIDFDVNHEVAQILYDYYSQIDARIMAMHQHPTLEMCDGVIRDLREMRETWAAIERAEQAKAPGGAGPIAVAPEETSITVSA
jgi:flagellar secretion chaperone FliS